MRILEYQRANKSLRHAARAWLVLEDGTEPDDAEDFLRAAEFEPAPPRLGFPHPPDLILLETDAPLPALRERIEWAKRRRPEAPLLLVTRLPSVERAVGAMRLGAADCLLLPLEPAEGARRLSAALPRPCLVHRLFHSGEVLRALAAGASAL